VTESVLFYALAVPAVILLGLSKGGFAGLGALSLPILAMAVSPVRAAAILLPILIVQDVVSVWAFRRSWDGAVLAWMLPGAVIGITLAYLFAAHVDPDAVLGLVGAISIVFGLYRLWLARRGAEVVAARSPGWVGTLAGVVSGFTSQIAHAGQPPFQMWVLPRRLERDVLLRRDQLAEGAGILGARPVQPGEPHDGGAADAGRDRLDLRRCLAGAAGVAGALLRRDLRVDGARRREAGVGRGGVAISRTATIPSFRPQSA
jgi:hypothetical protein